MFALWFSAVVLPTSASIAMVMTRVMVGPNKITKPWVLTICGLWLFILCIMGCFVFMFRLDGFYMQPDSKNKPKYEQIQEPVYKQVK
jgi:Na+-driven multidrug efflux pump